MPENIPRVNLPSSLSWAKSGLPSSVLHTSTLDFQCSPLVPRTQVMVQPEWGKNKCFLCSLSLAAELAGNELILFLLYRGSISISSVPWTLPTHPAVLPVPLTTAQPILKTTNACKQLRCCNHWAKWRVFSMKKNFTILLLLSRDLHQLLVAV